MLRKLCFAVAAVATAMAVQVPLQAEPLDSMPLEGFGTWNLKVDNTSQAVAYAIETGYRHIDAAKIYGNQVDVGNGISDGLKKAGLVREDIWVTSKLWNNQHGKGNARAAVEDTLRELQLDYLDLYLMHWPVADENGIKEPEYLDTWQDMITLLETGLTRRIGVSNFSPKQLDRLIQSAPRHKPYAHQFETHPYLKQKEFVAWHAKHGIVVTAYSPLGNTNPTYTSVSRKGASGSRVPPLLKNEVVKRIAESRNCTPAQVVLQWGLQRDTAVIPKSRHASYIKENYEANKCNLKGKDIEHLESDLPVKRFNNPSNTWRVCLYEGLEDGNDCIGSTLADKLQTMGENVQAVAWRILSLILG